MTRYHNKNFSIETTEYCSGKCSKADLCNAFVKPWKENMGVLLEKGRSPRKETLQKG